MISYRKHAQILLDSGHAYRCFCTPERLSQLRAEQEKTKQNAGYDRKCRNLSPEEEKKLLDAGTPYVIRFKIPSGRTVAFEDGIRGKIEYSSDVLDDLVLIKSDGFPTYRMANVVDDHLMAISHVLRGDGGLNRYPVMSSMKPSGAPVFAHLPVIFLPGDWWL